MSRSTSSTCSRSRQNLLQACIQASITKTTTNGATIDWIKWASGTNRHRARAMQAHYVAALNRLFSGADIHSADEWFYVLHHHHAALTVPPPSDVQTADTSGVYGASGASVATDDERWHVYQAVRGAAWLVLTRCMAMLNHTDANSDEALDIALAHLQNLFWCGATSDVATAGGTANSTSLVWMRTRLPRVQSEMQEALFERASWLMDVVRGSQPIVDDGVSRPVECWVDEWVRLCEKEKDQCAPWQASSQVSRPPSWMDELLRFWQKQRLLLSSSSFSTSSSCEEAETETTSLEDQRSALRAVYDLRMFVLELSNPS